MSVIPKDLHYTEGHEWIRVEDGVATVGISDYAQHELDDIVYVELPALNTEIEQKNEFGMVDSCKASSELYAPAGGEVIEVNTELDTSPELVNQDPYEKGWMIKMELTDPSQVEILMDAAAYEAFIANLEKEE